MDTLTPETKNEGFDRQVGFIEVVWTVLVGVFVLLIAAYAIKFSKNGWSTEPDSWGQFGDFIGGVLNPLVSLAALFALVVSVRMQRSELNDTRAELIEARKVATEQAKTAEQQRREQRFFDLLNLYQKTIDSMACKESRSMPEDRSVKSEIFYGKIAIAVWLKHTGNGRNFSNYIDTGIKEVRLVNNTEPMTVDNYWNSKFTKNFVAQYFRVVFRILTESEYLFGSDEQYRYIGIFCDQLNTTELELISLFMLLDTEAINHMHLIEKFSLLKNLPDGKLREEVSKVLSPKVFGKGAIA